MAPRKGGDSKKGKQHVKKHAPLWVNPESLNEDFEDPINAAIIQRLETLVKKQKEGQWHKLGVQQVGKELGNHL